MRKGLMGPILSVIGLLIIGGLFVYYYVSLNQIEKRLLAVQATTVSDANQIASITNFINSSLSAQTPAK
jgi:hypothetical protein